MNYKAVIFDMDGLLVDSELHWGPMEKEIWSNLGVEYTDSFRKKILGLKLDDIINYIKETQNPTLDYDFAMNLFNSKAAVVYQEKSNLLEGAGELISALQDNGVLLGLASSSPLEWIQMFLERFGFENSFKMILSTQTNGLAGKPDPEIYQKIIKDFKVRPEEVVVFEDSEVGVMSAKASGAKVIAIPDDRWTRGAISGADLTAGALNDNQVFDYLGLNQ